VEALGGAYGIYASGTTFGVVGSTGAGIGGDFSSGTGTGVFASTDSSASNQYAVEGISYATGPQAFTAAIYGQQNGSDGNGIGVWGQHENSGYGVYGTALGSGGYGVVGQAPTFALFGYGNTGATGTKSAAVRFADGKHRLLYSMESPECWFEDFGSATLRSGRARVKLDPKFAQTVKLNSYHVFLTPKGDSKGLYVSEETADGFSVREQEGGRSTLKFSYRIVALRKDVTAPRFKTVALATPPLAGARKASRATMKRAESRSPDEMVPRRLRTAKPSAPKLPGGLTPEKIREQARQGRESAHAPALPRVKLPRVRVDTNAKDYIVKAPIDLEKVMKEGAK
jgi:hypothetical protein